VKYGGKEISLFYGTELQKRCIISLLEKATGEEA